MQRESNPSRCIELQVAPALLKRQAEEQTERSKENVTIFVFNRLCYCFWLVCG